LDWKIGVENDNDNQIFIKDNWIHSLEEVVIEGPEIDIVKRTKGRKVEDRGRAGVKRRKNIHTKGCGAESRDNLAIS